MFSFGPDTYITFALLVCSLRQTLIKILLHTAPNYTEPCSAKVFLAANSSKKSPGCCVMALLWAVVVKESREESLILPLPLDVLVLVPALGTAMQKY